MATDVRKNVTTLTAGEALTADGVMHRPIAIGGTIAATNVAAVGLLQSKASSGSLITVAYEGEMKARAGAAISAGGLLMATTSGWLLTATDSRSSIGRALETAASGDLFRGLFNFSNAT